MNKEEIEAMNRTARGAGAVGNNAIIPRYIINHEWMKTRKMLDFGSGKDCIQTNMLKNIYGCNVTPYDIGNNYIKGIHLEKNESTKNAFQIVFASNVINVQPNEDCLLETLKDMFYFLDPEAGVCIFNYPSSPRKMDGLTKERLINYTGQVFSSVLSEIYENHCIISCYKYA